MRVLIFSGGNLDAWALSYINEGDYIIGVDRGAYFLYKNNIKMDAAIGDFDSVSEHEKRLISLSTDHIEDYDPINKDKTDTEIALDFALNKNPTEIVLLGVLGTRFDHSLANVHLLVKSLAADINCKIVDNKNEILVVNNKVVIHKEHFTHVSLLPLTSEVKGITLKGFKYPLENAAISIGETLGISNILLEETGTISIDTGILLVIKSID
ncbi:thiamine diphosphokinase [Bacillus sp. Marseille-P3661]|uniref:thiamine diphosphokinase n=1 Tax=Bacillus sp. Marseille-P3661 TaxID=1936234 RepID=UPI000C852324|nr:thiamine diphosphokinase [Bacillus sp. Marseille-P3661]